MRTRLPIGRCCTAHVLISISFHPSSCPLCFIRVGEIMATWPRRQRAIWMNEISDSVRSARLSSHHDSPSPRRWISRHASGLLGVSRLVYRNNLLTFQRNAVAFSRDYSWFYSISLVSCDQLAANADSRLRFHENRFQDHWLSWMKAIGIERDWIRT